MSKPCRIIPRAIALDPLYAEAHYNRGIAYAWLGNNQRAIKNFQVAARLGLGPAQQALQALGIEWQETQPLCSGS
jgi:tetratricopeptide (TPR) repeat protein